MDKTLVIFGSARISELSSTYLYAEELGRLCADNKLNVATGGGPGIMKAGSSGCYNNGGYVKSYMIDLPFEQNDSEEFSHAAYKYDHFSKRQRDLMLAGNAYVCFPGGMGTVYELTYLLTEITTGKMEAKPIILFDSGFWKSAIDFDVLIKYGTVSKDIKDYFIYADKPVEIIEYLKAKNVCSY